MEGRITIHISQLEILRGDIEKSLSIVKEETNTNRTVKNIIKAQGNQALSKSRLDEIWRFDPKAGEKETINLLGDTVMKLLSLMKDDEGNKRYADWKDYQIRRLNPTLGKGMKPLVFDDINIEIAKHIGEEITLGWIDKYCKFRVIDEMECEVIESVGMSRSAGDHFYTLGFGLHLSISGEVNIVLDDYGDGYFDLLAEQWGYKELPESYYFL